MSMRPQVPCAAGSALVARFLSTVGRAVTKAAPMRQRMLKNCMFLWYVVEVVMRCAVVFVGLQISWRKIYSYRHRTIVL